MIKTLLKKIINTLDAVIIISILVLLEYMHII